MFISGLNHHLCPDFLFMYSKGSSKTVAVQAHLNHPHYDDLYNLQFIENKLLYSTGRKLHKKSHENKKYLLYHVK